MAVRIVFLGKLADLAGSAEMELEAPLDWRGLLERLHANWGNAYPNPDRYGHTDDHANPDFDVHSHTHTHRNRAGDEHPHPNRHGNSYGDASMGSGGHVLDISRMNRVLAFDPETGIADCESGVTVNQLWKQALPHGWWPRVVSGTSFPSLVRSSSCLAPPRSVVQRKLLPSGSQRGICWSMSSQARSRASSRRRVRAARGSTASTAISVWRRLWTTMVNGALRGHLTVTR